LSTASFGAAASPSSLLDIWLTQIQCSDTWLNTKVIANVSL
jgi:hypothetical protein